MPALQFLQPLDIISGNRERDDADRHNLQLLPTPLDFPPLFRSQAADQRAAVWNALHQPLFFELEQGQPNVTTMGLKQLAEVQLNQPLARLAPSKDDVLLDALGDDQRRWFACPRCRS